MTEVWKRVLKIDQVGVHDNFFDVGGHSLLLPVLLSEIRREFRRDVAMVTLLDKTTISASAALFGDVVPKAKTSSSSAAGNARPACAR